MQDSPPEDRSRTISMLKHWDLWPLERTHRQSQHCACPACFGEPLSVAPDQLARLRAKRRRVALPWEQDYEDVA